jgi:hypothetical protein
MVNTLNLRDEIVVDLTDKVFVRTVIPKENHAALRSGFAGYPANPRWNITKYHAWKKGCQWRENLNRGKMVIRTEDSMLVPISEAQIIENKPVQETLSPRSCLFQGWNWK